MGERVDAAANETVEVEGQEVIFCPICGDQNGDPVQGHGTIWFAEANWIDVWDGSLYCNIEHAALGAGLSPAQAQIAKAEAARRIAREQGQDAIADADEKRLADIIANPERHPFAVALEEVADDETHDYVTPEEDKAVLSEEDQAWADSLLDALKRGDD
jgi:hypothetical protein